MADQQVSDPEATAGNPFCLVVVAASAGGVAALTEILAALTEIFPAALAIVQHRAPRAPSVLAHVLNRRSAMPVTDAKDGELFRPARVYLAPADYHLLVNADGTFSLTQSAKVHGTRPAAENLFESAANSFKERIIAVVLTGAGGDGENGVRTVKQMGGTVIAQDEATSEFFGMPRMAIGTGMVDFILPLACIAPKLLSPYFPHISPSISRHFPGAALSSGLTSPLLELQ
jgi:two-component system, chemotaxis family, protein-glutamate methylesterase/glutaminase